MASTSPAFHGVLIVLLVSLAANDVAAGRNIPTNDKAAANVKVQLGHFDGTMLVLCHGLHWALPERCRKAAHGPITAVDGSNHAKMPGYGYGRNSNVNRHGGGIPAAPSTP